MDNRGLERFKHIGVVWEGFQLLCWPAFSWLACLNQIKVLNFLYIFSNCSKRPYLWFCSMDGGVNQVWDYTADSGVREPTSSRVRVMPYFGRDKVSASCRLWKMGPCLTFHKICTNLIWKETFPMLSSIHFVWHSSRVWTCIPLKLFTMIYQFLYEPPGALLANFPFVFNWRILGFLTSNCFGLMNWILHWWQREAFRCAP